MQVVVQPSDVAKAAHSLGAFRDPVGVAGKIVGLGSDEVKAGVPTWAWCTVALAAGVFLGAKYGRKIPGMKEML